MQSVAISLIQKLLKLNASIEMENVVSNYKNSMNQQKLWDSDVQIPFKILRLYFI